MSPVEPKALVGVCPNEGVDPNAEGVPPKGEGLVAPKGELAPKAGEEAGLPNTEEEAAPKAGVDCPKVLLPKAGVDGPNAEEDCGCPKEEVLCIS